MDLSSSRRCERDVRTCMCSSCGAATRRKLFFGPRAVIGKRAVEGDSEVQRVAIQTATHLTHHVSRHEPAICVDGNAAVNHLVNTAGGINHYRPRSLVQ